MDTKEKIVYTAIKMFLQQGYKDVSINDIVKSVGITKGGFYHYFKSKEEMFEQAIETLYDRFYKEFIDHFQDEEQNIYEKLQVFRKVNIEAFEAEEFRDMSFRAYVLMAESMKMNERLYKKSISLFEQVQKQITKMLEEAKCNGEIREDLDCENAAFQLHATLEGITLLSVFLEKKDMTEQINMAFDNFWRTIKI